MTTLRKMIGQLLIVGFDGLAIDENSSVSRWLKNDGLGGVILFANDLHTNEPKNLKNVAQIKNLITKLNKFNNLHHPYPLLVGVDYEGGAVDRFSNIPKSPNTYTALDHANLSDEKSKIAFSAMASFLRELGFNLNFAPVVDLNIAENSGIIGARERSFGRDFDVVINKAKIFIETFNEYNILSCLKHFPGHGSARYDSHLGFVDVTEDFHPDELVPYSKLIDAKLVDIIMTAHVINARLSEDNLPATLSKLILSSLLRNTLNYNGIIISDDLQMHAIAKNYDLDDAMLMTINAGAHMLIFANQMNYIEPNEIVDRIENLVNRKAIALELIEVAFNKVVNLKKMRLCSQNALLTGANLC